MKKFYITTAIDYVNAEPHIGHAYQKIVADAISRWHSLKGDKVWFLTGTDEHGQKIAKSAKQADLSEKAFVDKMSKKFKQAWDFLEIKYSKFIRTTDREHIRFVQDFIKKIRKEIYKGTYEGLYCEGCEAFLTEKDLVNGECPYHRKKPEKIKEECYFFKLSKYQSQLLKLYETDFILPKEKRNEIKNRVKEGLKDLCITRTNFSWGVPFPGDEGHIVYVWFDALLNYLSGANGNWPADIHLLGKDNAWFHAVIWPAMLLSAGYELPKHIFIHGFLSYQGQKISKSLGNCIYPLELAKRYGVDSVRFAILRIPFNGDDGDISPEVIIERNNNELANKLGNLISRTTTLIEKYGLEKTPNILLKKLPLKQIQSHLDNYETDKALEKIFIFIDICNEFIQSKKPWETRDTKVLYQLADSIKAITILLSPFIPETTEKIAKHFQFPIKLDEINKPLKLTKLKKSEILFKKIDGTKA